MKLEKSLKILFVNPYGIGDALFSTPLIRTVKKTHPNSSISIFIGGRTAELFKHNPDIDHIYEYNRDLFRALSWHRFLVAFTKLMWSVRKKQFDVCIDLSNTSDYPVYQKFLWNIPKRIGFKLNNGGKFLTHRSPLQVGNSGDHVVDHYFKLLRFLDIPSSSFEKKLFFYPDPKEKIEPLPQSEKLVCFVPGGGDSWGDKAHYKYWPPSYYVTLGTKLLQDNNTKIVLIGNKNDKPLCDQIAASLPVGTAINMAGKTTLHHLALLFAKSSLVVGSDSGPMHIASAMGARTLVLFGPVSPVSYGPYTDTSLQQSISATTSCHPCYSNYRVPECSNQLCMKSITPEIVFSKLQDLPPCT